MNGKVRIGVSSIEVEAPLILAIPLYVLAIPIWLVFTVIRLLALAVLGVLWVLWVLICLSTSVSRVRFVRASLYDSNGRQVHAKRRISRQDDKHLIHRRVLLTNRVQTLIPITTEV